MVDGMIGSVGRSQRATGNNIVRSRRAMAGDGPTLHLVK